MSTPYYDALSPWYRLVYADWDASVERQAAALDRVIRDRIGTRAKRVLDAACGIGTQALGLAKLGYDVTALDLSSRAVEEARREAVERKLPIDFGVADMRWVGEGRREQYDVVIACDNALPHLESEADIATAFRQFRIALRPGGGCLVSVRDYASLERGGTQVHPRHVHEREGKRVALFDVWRFEGSDRYDFTTYVVEDAGTNGARVHTIRGGRYFCVELPMLERLARDAGFDTVEILRDAYFQPLLIARVLPHSTAAEPRMGAGNDAKGEFR